MTDQVNSTKRNLLGIRTGEAPLVEMDELTREQAQRLGASGKVSTSTGSYNARAYQMRVRMEEAVQSQFEKDRGTWFEHHDVPPAYRRISADGVLIANDVVERVLDALDPERELRRNTQLNTELVALLALPVQHETGMLGFKRANLDLVEADAITALNKALGEAIAAMKTAKAPRTDEYLWILRDAYLNGKGGNGKGTAAVDTAEVKKPNPFESDDVMRSDRIIKAVTRFAKPDVAYSTLKGAGAFIKSEKSEKSGPKGGAGSNVSEPPRADETTDDPLNVKSRSTLPAMGIMLVFGLEPQPVTDGAKAIQFAGLQPVNGVNVI